MENKRKLQLGLAGVVTAFMVLGLTPHSDSVLELREPTEGGLLVPVEEYRGVVQERSGYAFYVGQYVGKSIALRKELTGWQDMVRELSGMAARGTLAHRYSAAEQERLGYQVATERLLARRHGDQQRMLGLEVALAHSARLNQALRQ
ncbi:MAG: hypothetical protein ACE5FN_01250 [Leptospirillia bacterium]